MSIAVSVLVLVGGMYVILSTHFNGESRRWATGAVGAVIGYWLR